MNTKAVKNKYKFNNANTFIVINVLFVWTLIRLYIQNIYSFESMPVEGCM